MDLTADSLIALSYIFLHMITHSPPGTKGFSFENAMLHKMHGCFGGILDYSKTESQSPHFCGSIL